MFFIYSPEDGEPQEWWFDPQKVRAQEAEAIEKRTGWDWAEFGVHLLKGSALARRALLWTYLRRTHHILRFEDVDFALGEVTVEYSKEELENIREQTDKADADPAQKVLMLQQLDAQIAEAREGPGKARTSGADSNTPSP